MSIIKPGQYKKTLGFLFKVFILIIAGGIFYIYQYNMVADNRYEVEGLKEGIIEAQVANAEIKNTLYEVIDPTALEEIADTHNLVLERTPQYLNLNQWVSDSSY